jgi:transposase
MSKRKKKPNYTQEFKEDAVKLVTEQGYSNSEVGRRLGVNPSNVSRWVRQHRQDQEDIGQSGVTRRELESKNRKLEKENKRLRMEREILKKATAFFARESR